MRHFRNGFRFLFIIWALLIRGITPWNVKRVPPGRLARALTSMGPSFIKLGQTLSTRADVIGPELAAALVSLRDDVPPFPHAEAVRIIEQESGKKLTDIFSHFPDMPIAAASVAQVYKAVTRDGRTVAVKILRPRVERRFAKDISLFMWIAKLMTRFVPSSRRLKPIEVVETLAKSIAFELDMRFEAAAIKEMAGNLQPEDGWRVPMPDWRLTGQRVLVTEWMDGIRIHDVSALKAAGHDMDAILARFSSGFFMHVFRDGFFHADLHPGNVFVDADGAICVVDFGIMGRLDWKSRLYMAEIFHSFLKEDYRRVAELHFKAGYVPARHSVEEFTQACMAITKPVLDRPVHEISMASLLSQLFAVTKAFDMETQPQLLMLQKTLVVVEGVGRMLNPSVNMWEMSRKPIEQWAREHLGVQGRVKHAAQELFEIAEKIPPLLRRLVEEVSAK